MIKEKLIVLMWFTCLYFITLFTYFVFPQNSQTLSLAKLSLFQNKKIVNLPSKFFFTIFDHQPLPKEINIPKKGNI